MTSLRAKRITVAGRVQGVGFRPFVLRLARELDLKGWVRNSGGVVDIHVEGTEARIGHFLDGVGARSPGFARPLPPVAEEAAFEGHAGFVVLDSVAEAPDRPSVPPDCFVCEACLDEMSDPRQRRYRYPFTNCTQCGPRYTIIDALPYDRERTSMSGFPMCDDCASEYGDAGDRRYHAQPLACPKCGPRLEFRRLSRASISGDEPALEACAQALEAGEIVAVKGIGGYHLLCDATSTAAIETLRHRKNRPAKPLAVMASDPLLARHAPELPPAILEALRSPFRPIVLAPKQALPGLAGGIAPGLDEIGLILPYSPLHHILLERLDRPIVATSGNVSGEPILFDPLAAEQRLGSVADAFLHHDRPIRRPADDSVLRVIAGAARPVRIGRGLGPLEIELRNPVTAPLLAVGGDLKNTIALAVENRAIVSPHLGDLGAPRAQEVFEEVVSDLCRLYAIKPARIVCDAHPGYFSKKWAERRGLPTLRVFHHHAHASAAYAELETQEDVLAFTWDGVGYGEDGGLWGGEALFGRPGAWRRAATIHPLRMIGGDKASREPWRCALAACLATGVPWADASAEAIVATQMWERGFNSPETTSVGRLFDAASALLGLSSRQSFEGEAAMLLEAAARPGELIDAVSSRDETGVLCADWRPLVQALLDREQSIEARASYFHRALSGLLVDQAVRLRSSRPFTTVLLCGGVFQNRLLAEGALAGLGAKGFRGFLPRRAPVNDASLSLGQIIEAEARLR